MDPVAFKIGSLSIHWYGICFSAGFLAGYELLRRRARRNGLGEDAAEMLALVAMIAGVVGARALYVLQNWEEFAAAPLDMVLINRGGLVFYGGFVAAATAILVTCHLRKLSIGAAGDAMAPALALGHAFGRLGCFLNGCCFGRVYEGLGAHQYPANGAVAAVQAQQELIAATGGNLVPLPVFPVQLLEAGLNIAIVAVLLLAERRWRRRGILFPLYMVLYAVVRFSVEFLRGDYLSRVGGLTPAQLVCLVLFPVALGLLALVWRKSRPATAC